MLASGIKRDHFRIHVIPIVAYSRTWFSNDTYFFQSKEWSFKKIIFLFYTMVFKIVFILTKFWKFFVNKTSFIRFYVNVKIKTRIESIHTNISNKAFVFGHNSEINVSFWFEKFYFYPNNSWYWKKIDVLLIKPVIFNIDIGGKIAINSSCTFCFCSEDNMNTIQVKKILIPAKYRLSTTIYNWLITLKSFNLKSICPEQRCARGLDLNQKC